MVTRQTDEQDYSISGSDEPGGADLEEEDLGLPDEGDDDPPYDPGSDPDFENRLLQRDEEISQRERNFVEADRITQFRKQVQGTYDQQYQQLYQVLTQRGYPEDEAKGIADNLAFTSAQSSVFAFDAHWNRVQKVAMQEGVPEEAIADCPNEPAMRQRAQHFRATGGPENAQLQQRVAQLERQLQMSGGRAPQYNQPGTGGRGGVGSYVKKLKSGGPLPSAREIDRMTSRYLRA